jgi:hypothetical protein
MPLNVASPVRVVPLPTKPASVPSLMSRASDSLSLTAREVVEVLEAAPEACPCCDW